ncbi:MAG: DUF502 domain-containing protein [Dehalococcoidia bacterium]
MPDSIRRVRGRISRSVSERLRLYFGTGILLLLPIAITFFLLKLVFDFLDGILQPIFEAVFGVRIPGVGLVALVLLVLAVGMIGSAKLGSRAVVGVQALLLKLPLIRNVYSATTQLMDIFSSNQTGDDAKRVVVIEYPRPGIWSIGFLMAITADENHRSMGVVYIPTAPMPNSGWVAVLPLADVYETDLSVQQTSQIVLSGGLLIPQELPKRPLQQRLVDSLQEQLVSHREELEARRREMEELRSRMQVPPEPLERTDVPGETSDEAEAVAPQSDSDDEEPRKPWWRRW